MYKGAGKARGLGGDKTVPILWVDEKLAEAMETVKVAGYREAILFTL